MKIVDTFMFSEHYESDVLWVKLNVGNPGIDEWVIIENSYTFQGNYKGHHLNDLLRTDKRFSQFLPKIKVIETHFEFGKVSAKQNWIESEKQAFSAEFLQRESSKNYILKNYNEDDWLILSDTDECIDLTGDKLDLFKTKLVNSTVEIVEIPRIKYTYDYNNRTFANRSTPAIKICSFNSNKQTYTFGPVRKKHCLGTKKWKQHILFEYSFCFSKVAVEKKYNSFAHVGFNTNKLGYGLKINCSLGRDGKVPEITQLKCWFELIELTKYNTPEFVLNNLQNLKTNIVDSNYKINRRKQLPNIFSGFNGLKTSWFFYYKRFRIVFNKSRYLIFNK